MKTITLLFGLIVGGSLMGQTATNWTANDCAGNSHNLYSDLDAGKVAVIIWVMPCGACINGALAAQTEVQAALASHPGKVVYYLVDDYGNTSCTALNGWVNSNGITNATVISSNLISMSPYGTPGMPKIVVAGGVTHKVFYNENDGDITAGGIKNAITQALTAATGITEKAPNTFYFSVHPNPSNTTSKIAFNLVNDADVTIEVISQLGEKVLVVHSGELSSGSHNFSINTQVLANGFYFVRFSDGLKKVQERLLVDH